MAKEPFSSVEIQEHFELLTEIEKESDRAAAILALTFLDTRLTEALETHISKKGDTWKELTRKGHLNPIMAKAKLLYCLGFYGPKTLADITTLCEIRNLFAHKKEALRFDSSEITKLCGRLSICQRLGFPEETAPPDAPRQQYLSSVFLIWNLLWSEISQNSPSEKREPRFMPD